MFPQSVGVSATFFRSQALRSGVTDTALWVCAGGGLGRISPRIGPATAHKRSAGARDTTADPPDALHAPVPTTPRENCIKQLSPPLFCVRFGSGGRMGVWPGSARSGVDPGDEEGYHPHYACCVLRWFRGVWGAFQDFDNANLTMRVKL